MGAAAAAAPIFLQAAGSVFEGITQSQTLKSAAAVDRENARLTELEGALATEDIRRRARATQGEALVALGESGASVGGQSAQDLLFQNALEAEFQVLSTRFSSATEARALRTSAAQKRQAARSAVIGGVLRAGAAAITGAQDAANSRSEAEARRKRNDALFPGGQRLPMPPGAQPRGITTASNPFVPFGAGR